jgi:integrase
MSDGYGTNGKRVRHSKTWTPEPGWSAKRVKKELARAVILFEEAGSAGKSQDGNVKFQSFAERFLAEYADKQLKLKTVSEYKKRMKRVYTAIGHIRLRDLRTGHLNTLYANLLEDGMNRKTGERLSASSVRGYHCVISSILSKAVKWGFIPYNPALNAELPKLDKKEAAYLDEADARRLLTLLHDEPIKYRVMVSFDLMSGLRRGELLGLRWRDVDFDSETITIVQTSQYVKGHGVYVDTPKNETSSRVLKLSRSAFIMLREYMAWQNAQREACGDYWKPTDGRVFTSEDGSPIHPDALTKWFKAFIKRHGFPDVHLHSLRHTYASMMIADGTPLVVVSKRLGHAQVSATSNIYSHIIKSADEKASQVTEKFADVIAPLPAEIIRLKKA